MMQINQIKVERILSNTSIALADYVINPFRGCEYGCVYCYSRQNKNAMSRKENWGDFLDVKINAAALLEKELKGKTIRRVLIGSTTDPYQLAEGKFKLTRAILELFASRNVPAIILTRSPEILRDMDLLQQHPENIVYVTLNSLPKEIVPGLEPKTAAMGERLKALKELKKHGIKTVAYVSPYLPGITRIRELFEEIKDLTDRLHIELYNMKMGNWEAAGKILREALPDEYAAMEDIFRDKTNYNLFGAWLKDSLAEINREYAFKLEVFLPEYNAFYSRL